MDNLRPQHLPLSDPDSSRQQLLSDWELEMHFDGELLEVRLSAALFAAEPTHVWEKDHIGHWSVGNGIPSRIEIAFSVDLATRVAASHAAYINTETQATESANPFSSTLSTLRLATAPIDTMGQVFGVMRNGQWARLETENGGILITPHNAKKRLGNGFLLRDTGHRWPSVSLRVISIDTLLRPLWRERHVTLEMKDAVVGSLIQDRGFHEMYQPVPLQMIARAQLELRVDIHGLQFSYRLYVTDLDVSQKEYKAGWLEDGITIPWEVVILRFPEMLWHRKALLEELLP
jgi:hypothetical protein